MTDITQKLRGGLFCLSTCLPQKPKASKAHEAQHLYLYILISFSLILSKRVLGKVNRL